jgi:hypothetical protein
MSVRDYFNMPAAMLDFEQATTMRKVPRARFAIGAGICER